ncbi:RNA polymerase I subunit Rpl135 [Aphomia sociella]
MKCAGCMKSTKDSNTLRCTSAGCDKAFCTLCINVSNINAERRRIWKCPDCCAVQKKGGDNSLTPVRACSDSVTVRKKTESTESDISSLTEQLRLLTVEFSAVKSKLDDVTQSLVYSNERMEEVMLKWAVTEERLRCLEKRDDEIESLRATVTQLQKDLRAQGQQNLRNEIEIVGIPESPSENLHHTILVAARKVGLRLEDSDLDWVARVGPRRSPVTTALPEDGARMPRPVVVRLLQRSKRDEFLKAAKSRKNLSNTDLDVPGNLRKVFFNERLTKELRTLFRDTRSRAKQHGYAFCWCTHGVIYIRQREGKGALPVSSYQVLDSLLPPISSASVDKCLTLHQDESKKVAQKPSLSYTSNPNYSKPPKTVNPSLQCLGAPHIDSFNYMLQDGLKAAIADLIPAEFEAPNGDRVKIVIEEAAFSKPSVPIDVVGIKTQRVLPTECRQRAATYKGDFKIRLTLSINGKNMTLDKSLGNLPIMLKSKMCHLADLSPEELIKHNEHGDEWGGYFVVKGHERLARMLLVTRRNYPVAIKRPSWRMRGNMFTDYGILVRCVKPDQTNTTNVLHFLQNGSCKLMFSHRKVMYYAPLLLIMKCLVDWPDHYIYRLLLHGKKNDLYYVNCIQNMLRELHEEGLHTSEECRAYLGRMFRQKLYDLPPWSTDEQVTDFLLDRCVMIHLPDHKDKFNGLVFMAQKLFDLVQNKCKVEGADAVMVQELLLGGHLYLQVLKERLQMIINVLKSQLVKRANSTKKLNVTMAQLPQMIRMAGNLESKMETFLATGNAPSNNVNLSQYKGLTIVAENINRMRYMSHFKAIHRGSFFMEMRTTEARQLLPDAWGFVCPVHTPDGAPCGLLNHLTMAAQVTQPPDAKQLASLPYVLKRCGMEQISTIAQTPLENDVYKYPVFLDGRLVGYFAEDTVDKSTTYLRTLKVKGEEIPITTEIVVIPKKQICSQYAGVFLFTTEARMMRPVINLATGSLELIGTLEQLYLDVAVTQEEIIKGRTTHLELSKSAFMSNLAQLVPMPDCNQSPRNMYQCQMGKQTMGTPIHTWATSGATKLYRLQTPASPLFRPAHYDHVGLDDYPAGTNAIVAVISYSGYDMEDAMIINKSAYERGFAAGSIYKADFVELQNSSSYFQRDPNKPELSQHIDEDGLPAVGARIQPNDPFYCYYDGDKSQFVVSRYHGKEEVFVDSVRLCGDFTIKSPPKACIMLRIQRNPTVGDKFASRAGQKGICSQLWAAEDLPFTESGLIPDILFNPHGFPSRMTIAMMIECMAGKAACLHGHVHDATPFRFNEKDTAIAYFGRLLQAAGYGYYGSERVYSGVDGRELTADVFCGLVHYQRLRHMVSDKWQVRTTGVVDALTRQPVKGRRRGGGVRLGEMERDALLSHGAAFLLQDRLLHCSDRSDAILCTKCGTLLGPLAGKLDGRKETCRLCNEGDLVSISIPYIFKFFVTQLAAVNINIKINCNTNLAIKSS